MRAYSASSEEALRARTLLKDWAGEGFLTEAQYQRMEQETVCDLRRTNIFLRLVLFLFTLIIVGAAVGLTYLIFRPESQSVGILLLIFAALSYGFTEFAVSQGRFYRHGIEEALAACSVGFLCAGMQFALFTGSAIWRWPDGMEFLVPAAGAVVSLWIWYRFGLHYAFLAAMIFVIWLPGYWTSSHTAHHVIVAAVYATGLIAVAVVRPRHRFTYLNGGYSIVEGLLWLGVYLAINLQLSSLKLLLASRWVASPGAIEFSRTIYCASWALTWCLPPAILARGVFLKDRFVIATGAVAALLTLVTNKPYLGWPRHTWDPMLLGALLIGIALFLRRWLAQAPGGIRHGFTARRLSGKEKHWISVGSAAFGTLSPHQIMQTPHTETPAVEFGGGDSGGGGASSDF